MDENFLNLCAKIITGNFQSQSAKATTGFNNGLFFVKYEDDYHIESYVVDKNKWQKVLNKYFQ